MTTQVVNTEMIDLLMTFFINCWIPIANGHTQLTAPAATVTLPTAGTLSADFRTLVLMSQARTDAAATADQIDIQFNGDGGANYNRLSWTFDGTGAHPTGVNRGITEIRAFLNAEGGNSRASNFGIGLAIFPGYALTDREKQCFGLSFKVGDLSADAQLVLRFAGGQWQITPIAAITSMTLLPRAGPNFVAGCKFSLYGVL